METDCELALKAGVDECEACDYSFAGEAGADVEDSEKIFREFYPLEGRGQSLLAWIEFEITVYSQVYAGRV